jgi:tetratricopeptide (TPR) repeat protein
MPPSKDVQAYELYVQARSVAHGTDVSERHAALLLDQALARDPDFANALGLRAITHAGAVALSGAPLPLLEGAERDAARALSLNPRSVEANTAQELIFALRGNWVPAEQSFRAAMATGANDPVMRSFHDMILLRPTGRLQQARSELTETYHLAPDDGFTAHELALTDSLLGLDADATKFGDLGERIGGEGPPHSDIELVRARAAARAGRYAAAVDFAVRALPESLRNAGGEQAMRAFYAALADAAKRPAALGALGNIVPALKTSVVEGRTRMFFVDALVMIGALDEAYDLAEWSADQRAQTPGSIEWSDVWLPEMRTFRTDARFQSFVTRLKLPDYWRVYGPPDECDFKNDILTCH